MYSYLETMRWHKNGENSKHDDDEIAFVYDAEMIQSKLQQGLGRIWQVGYLIKQVCVCTIFYCFKHSKIVNIEMFPNILQIMKNICVNLKLKIF